MTSLSLPGGLVAVIDDSDVPRTAGINWRAQPISRAAGGHYVYASINRRKVYLHRFLSGAPSGMEVDHVNGNGLDNRRCNLRVCTTSQNNANRQSGPNKTGYRGVCFEAERSRYQARIYVDGRCIRGGWFASATEAAKARDALAVKHFGSFALLNFPDRLQPRSAA